MDNKRAKKPVYKRWWFWVLAVLLIIIIIGAASGGGSDNTAGPGATNTASPRASGQPSSPIPSPAPSSPAPPSPAPSSPAPPSPAPPSPAPPSPAPPSPAPPSPALTPSAAPSVSPTAVKADLQLTSGNYTAGTDFPAGQYDILAVSGGGNVSSSNMYSGGINAMMGTEAANKTAGGNLYEQQYSNIKLPEGVVLSVSGGVTIRITADTVSTAPLKKRVQPNTQSVDLGNGNFVAGEDFAAGTYDIVAVSGGGNVSSDNMYSGGINAVMGPKGTNSGSETLMYEPEYKNIELPKGTTLTIDGVKIRLVPSK